MNLIFKRLRIENFFSIGQADVSFRDQGIVYVKGINNETNPPQSNGSGKSSIFDAILWTLYGETLRGASEVKNSFTDDGTMCELFFSIDNTDYTIRRAKSHSTYGSNIYVYENGELISDSIKKSQEAISSILSISSAQILGSIVLLGQGLPYKFSDLSQIKRKELLEELSGSSEQIAKIQDSLTKQKNKYESTVSLLELSSKESSGKITGFTSALNNLKALIENQQSSEDIDLKVKKCQEQISMYTEESEELSKENEKTEVTIKQISDIVNSVNTFISVKQQELNKTVREHDSLQTVCPVCKRPFDSIEDIKKHRAELENNINTLNDELGLLKTKLFNNQAILNEKSQEKSQADFKIWSLANDISKLNSEISSLNTQKTHSQNLETQIKDIENNITEENRKYTQSVNDKDVNQNILDCINWLLRETSREFKGVLLEDTVKLLSYKAQQYGNYLVDDKDIKIELSGSKVLISLGNTLYENLSGGERRRVDLSVQFALRDMLSITNGFTCNLLVLDEVFDNLDIQGAEKLITLISSKFSDVESMYIITHHTDFDIPYDCILTVTKNQGVSSLQFG